MGGGVPYVPNPAANRPFTPATGSSTDKSPFIPLFLADSPSVSSPPSNASLYQYAEPCILNFSKSNPILTESNKT